MSLYMFWYFVLFILCLSLAFHTLNIERWTGIVLPILFFSASLYSIYLLQVRFCYLRLEADRLTVVSAGREIHYAYDNLLKVNFDFAREPNATHVMEILDKTYRYRLYYIGCPARSSTRLPNVSVRQASTPHAASTTRSGTIMTSIMDKNLKKQSPSYETVYIPATVQPGILHVCPRHPL